MRTIDARITTVHAKNASVSVETHRGNVKVLEVPHMDGVLQHLRKLRRIGQFVAMTVEDGRLIGTMARDTEGNFIGYHHFDGYWRDRNETE